MANIADGVFNIAGDMVEILSSPDLTREMYDAFLELAKSAQRGEIEENAFVQTAAAIDPRLERVAKLAIKHKGWAFIALLIIWLNSCVSLDVKIDTNEMLDQLFGQPNVEYVLSDNETLQGRKGDIESDRANGSKNSSQQQKSNYIPIVALHQAALFTSTSALTIASRLR